MRNRKCAHLFYTWKQENNIEARATHSLAPVVSWLKRPKNELPTILIYYSVLLSENAVTVFTGFIIYEKKCSVVSYNLHNLQALSVQWILVKPHLNHDYVNVFMTGSEVCWCPSFWKYFKNKVLKCWSWFYYGVVFQCYPRNHAIVCAK